MTTYIEELGPLKSMTQSNSGIVAGDFEWSQELGPDQFIRVLHADWQMTAGAAGEYIVLSFQGNPADVNLIYTKSTGATTFEGQLVGPIDSNLGNLLEILTIHSNAGTASNMNVVYRVVTIRQANGQPITPACTIWKRLLGVC